LKIRRVASPQQLRTENAKRKNDRSTHTAAFQ
jgi:hypothetical protein